MLEMMPIPGPAIQGPVMSGPGQTKLPDCGNFNCSLSFMAIQGMDVTAAKNNLEVDASTHIGENILQFPVSISDLNIKKQAVTLANGQILEKEMLFSEYSDQSLQEVTNFEEGNSQVWRQVDEISDSVINSPVDSWHALLSPDQTSSDNNRMMLFHKKDEANVREYYVTVNLSSDSLEKLKGNLQGEANSQKDEIFIFTESGKQLGDFYALIEKSFTLREKKEKQSYLDRLNQDIETGDSFILQRQEKVRKAVTREADKILKDDISLTAIGLLGQSLNIISDQISGELGQNINNKEMPRITTRIEPERKIEERRETQPLYSERDVDEREEKEPELNSEVSVIPKPFRDNITKPIEILKSPTTKPDHAGTGLPPIGRVPDEAGQFRPSIPDQPLFAEITFLISQAIVSQFIREENFPIEKEEKSIEQHNVLKDNGIPVSQEGKVPAEISPIIIQAFLNQINNPEDLPELEKNSSKDIPDKAVVEITSATPENKILSVFVPIIVQVIISEILQEENKVPKQVEIFQEEKREAVSNEIPFNVNNESLSEFLDRVSGWVDHLFKEKETDNGKFSTKSESYDPAMEREVTVELLEKVESGVEKEEPEIVSHLFSEDGLKDINLAEIGGFDLLTKNILAYFEADHEFGSDPADKETGKIFMASLFGAEIGILNNFFEFPDPSEYSHKREIESVTINEVPVNKINELKNQIEQILLTIINVSNPDTENSNTSLISDLNEISISESFKDITPIIKLLSSQESTDKAISIDKSTDFKIVFFTLELMMQYRLKKELENKPLPKILPLIVYRQIEVLLSMIKENNNESNDLSDYLPEVSPTKSGFTCPDQIGAWGVNKIANPYEIWSIIRSLIYMKKLTQAKNKKKRKIKKMRSYGIIFAYQPLVNSL